MHILFQSRFVGKEGSDEGGQVFGGLDGVPGSGIRPFLRQGLV